MIEDVWSEAQDKPEVAAAIQAIVEAVNVLKNSQSLHSCFRKTSIDLGA